MSVFDIVAKLFMNIINFVCIFICHKFPENDVGISILILIEISIPYFSSLNDSLIIILPLLAKVFYI